MSQMFTPEQQAEVNRIVGDRLERDRRTRAEVVSEPRTYALESPFSYFLDLSLAAEAHYSGAGGQARAARKRQISYARELGSEMARGTSEGKRAERVLRSADRHPNRDEHERRFRKRVAELRAFGTDGGTEASSPGEAASFVSPAFLLEAWVPFRGAVRAFSDQCHKVPLPAYGMHVYIPYFSTGTKATSQAEGAAVTETAPVAAYEGSEVKTATGQVIMSAQMRDRAFYGGGSIDAVIYKQLQQQLSERVDIITLTEALSKAAKVTGASSFTFEGFYKDLALSREEVTDTAGTRLRPTHFFSSSDFYSYVTRQFDKQERPIYTPKRVSGFPAATGADEWDAAGVPIWSRFLGTTLPGDLVWVADDNIPTLGTYHGLQLITSAPAEAVVLMEDEPVATTFTETLGNTMRVVCNLREYVSAVSRHASGTVVLNGGAYTATLV